MVGAFGGCEGMHHSCPESLSSTPSPERHRNSDTLSKTNPDPGTPPHIPPGPATSADTSGPGVGCSAVCSCRSMAICGAGGAQTHDQGIMRYPRHLSDLLDYHQLSA